MADSAICAYAARRARGYGRLAPVPPGPKGLPAVGSYFELRSDPFELMSHGAATHGDIFRIPMPFLDMVAVTHPDLLREFMDDPDGRFSRYDLLGPLQNHRGQQHHARRAEVCSTRSL